MSTKQAYTEGVLAIADEVLERGIESALALLRSP